MLEAIILIVFPFCMLFAAVSDMLSMTIANRVSIILVAAFVIVAPLTGMNGQAIAWHLAAGVIVLCATFILFAFGGMGGGDAKLMSASAVWMGFGFNLIAYLVAASFLGGLLTLAVLAYRGSPLAVYTAGNRFLRNFTSDAKGVPYGIALGVAGIVVYPETPLMIWAMGKLASG
ncbi:MAG: prepilin peptidase [Rhizobiaceae bacterium]